MPTKKKCRASPKEGDGGTTANGGSKSSRRVIQSRGSIGTNDDGLKAIIFNGEIVKVKVIVDPSEDNDDGSIDNVDDEEYSNTHSQNSRRVTRSMRCTSSNRPSASTRPTGEDANDDGSVASTDCSSQQEDDIFDYYSSFFGEKATVTAEERADYLRNKAKELSLIQTKLNEIGRGHLYQQLIDNIDLAIIRNKVYHDLVARTTREANKTDNTNEAEETDNNNADDDVVLFEEVNNHECDGEHDDIDDDYVSQYSPEYIAETNLNERHLNYIAYCYSVQGDVRDNDTEEFWNKHHAIAERNADRPVPTKTYTKSQNPLRKIFFRTRHHNSSKFDKCVPHPPFDWKKVVWGMPLFEQHGQVYTVSKVLPEIRRLRDAMYAATGRNVAMFPRVSDNSKIVKNFYDSDCLLARIGKAVEKLKHRVTIRGSEIAQRALKVMKREAGLVTENSEEFKTYHSRSDVDDGRSHYYCGVLYQEAGLPPLEKMAQYNMKDEVDMLVQQVRDNKIYRALAPLRAEQQRVTEELMQKSDEIQQFILDNDPSDCEIFKWLLSILGSSCRHCGARQQCNGHKFRGASFIQHVAHISDIGRRAKKTIVGGKHPSKCTFLELLKQLPVVELMCGEDHLGKEDNWRLGELIAGDSDGDVSFKQSSGYSWKQIYRARVAVQVMHELSNGKCQLDLSYAWKLFMKGGMDIHHLSMKLGFIDTNGVPWETGKSYSSATDGNFMKQLMNAPEAQWRTFLVNDCSICVIASSSGHQLLHRVYGPKSINQLQEHLGIEFGWRETKTHIIMLPQEEEEEQQIMKGEVEHQPADIRMKDSADAITGDLPNDSGAYTITGTEMAPQVPGFGEYYEQPPSKFDIPFSLEPGLGGEDSDDWFEVDGDDRIIERGRREKSILEEIQGENYLLNKDKDVDQLTSVIDSDKENIDAKRKRKREIDMDWSITKEDIIDAKKLEEEIAAMKAKRQKCEEYLAATAFVEELS